MRYFLYNAFNSSRQIRIKNQWSKTEKCHTGDGGGGKRQKSVKYYLNDPQLYLVFFTWRSKRSTARRWPWWVPDVWRQWRGRRRRGSSRRGRSSTSACSCPRPSSPSLCASSAKSFASNLNPLFGALSYFIFRLSVCFDLFALFLMFGKRVVQSDSTISSSKTERPKWEHQRPYPSEFNFTNTFS